MVVPEKLVSEDFRLFNLLSTPKYQVPLNKRA